MNKIALNSFSSFDIAKSASDDDTELIANGFSPSRLGSMDLRLGGRSV
ncbi:MAG: hypothetical protein NC433_08680 [Clostridiales bacterium]|nr:hypothetical protein [Clostridiales bacterium]